MPPKLNHENVQIMYSYDVQSNDRHYKCGACAAMLIDRRALMLHIRVEHMGQPLCESCGRLMRSNAELKSHLKAHTKTIGYWCIIKGCGYFFPQEKSAEAHAKSHLKGALLGKKLKDYYISSELRTCEPSAHQSIPSRTLHKLTVNHPMKIELPMSAITEHLKNNKHELRSYRWGMVPNASMSTVEEMELTIANSAQKPQDMLPIVIPSGTLSSSSVPNNEGPENNKVTEPERKAFINKRIQEDENPTETKRQKVLLPSEGLKPAIQLVSSEPTVSSNCAEPMQRDDETLEAEIRSVPQFPSTQQSATVSTSGLTFADNKSDSNISSDDDAQSMMGLQNVPITVVSPSDAMDYEEKEKGQENETEIENDEKEIEGVLKEEIEQQQNNKQILQTENISKQTVKVNNKLQSQKFPVIHIPKRVNLDASSSSSISTASREQQKQPDSHCFECHKKVEDLDESRNCSLCALTYHLSCVESGNLFKKKQHAIEQYDALEEKPEGDDHNKLRTPNEVCDECVLKIVGKCFNRSVDGFDRPNVSYPNDVKTTYEYIANRLIYLANKWKKENKHVRKLKSTAKLLGDLKEIEKRAAEYSSIDEIIFDVKMIKHNRIISRKSISIAESAVTSFCAELLDKAIEEVRHIYLCDSCYRMFYSEKSENVPKKINKGWTTYDTVFGLPCQNPHMVVWVQIDGEWYPGKVFPNYEKCSWELSTDSVQVVTFGPQANIKVDSSELYDYSIELPDCGQFLNENQQLAIEEANKYLARLDTKIYDILIPERARPYEQGNFYINLKPGQLSMEFVCAVCEGPADTKLDSCINSYCSDACRNVFLGRSSSKK